MCTYNICIYVAEIDVVSTEFAVIKMNIIYVSMIRLCVCI
jgi:hypothetical protein